LEKAFYLKRQSFLRTAVSLLILMLMVATVAQTADAALTCKNVKIWYWLGDLTKITSVAKGDVDSDGKTEIVTGGYYGDATTGFYAQLCVWDGATLALKNVAWWDWNWGYTYLNSVAIGDVDGDGKAEIVTGGDYGGMAQLCVWDGATLALKNVKTWYWTSSTYIESVAVGDVDADGKAEIVTGGYYNNGTRDVAQLCVWDGATLTLKNVQTWQWGYDTVINSVAISDVDGDAKNEIVTGGNYYTGSNTVAQLCVWNGATLALKSVKAWFWIATTVIYSVAVGDVDADGKAEIVTGGYYWDVTRDVAQLCVWDGATLALENVRVWYWSLNTVINSIAVGDVDADGEAEIVTGGSYYDLGIPNTVAQLCVWDGTTLALENIQTWYWNSHTEIFSVAIGDVDADGKKEIVTGGYYYELPPIAQLCVWAW
jgi:hypothetical protein